MDCWTGSFNLRYSMVQSITILLLFSVLYGNVPEEPSVIELIRQKYSDKTTLTADFEQTIYWNVREKTTKNGGTITLAPGDRFKVELRHETYVSDGTVFWHYNRSSDQVVIRNLGDLDLSTQPSHLLGTFLNRYRFREKSRSGKEITLEWNSDSSGADMKNVTLTVNSSTGIVNKLSYTDSNSNVHTYTFSRTSFGKTIPESTFSFEVPPDAQCIDHRQ